MVYCNGAFSILLIKELCLSQHGDPRCAHSSSVHLRLLHFPKSEFRGDTGNESAQDIIAHILYCEVSRLVSNSRADASSSENNFTMSNEEVNLDQANMVGSGQPLIN